MDLAARAARDSACRATSLWGVPLTADPPEIVAEAVVLATTAARPRRRYPTGKIARRISVLRRLVPADAFDKSPRKQMRLPA